MEWSSSPESQKSRTKLTLASAQKHRFHSFISPFVPRGGSVQGPPRLGHGGEEPVRHGRPGRRHVRRHHPHPVQVLLQAQVEALFPWRPPRTCSPAPTLTPPTRPVSVEAVSAEDEDADVARERRRVQEGGAQDDLLRVCDLTKVTCSSPASPDCLIAPTLMSGAVASGNRPQHESDQ